jgi:ribosomal-protein-alanine N-acetyltransferase
MTKLRIARPADARGIFDLEQHFSSDRMSLRSVRNFLRSGSARVWVAVPSRGSGAPGAVLAALILLVRRGAKAARIYSVVVAPAARGQGFGSKLVRLAETAARVAGCLEISLEVRAENTAARRLYARSGYAEAGRLPGFYEDGADGLRLCKRLVAR